MYIFDVIIYLNSLKSVSSRVYSLLVLLPNRLWAQNDIGSPDWMRRHRFASTNVLFLLSAIPFCSRLPATVSCHSMPFFAKKSLNSTLIYSMPLSHCNLILFSFWFSTNTFFELLECVALLLEKMDLKSFGIIIDKYNEIFGLIIRLNSHESDEFKYAYLPIRFLGKNFRIIFSRMHVS